MDADVAISIVLRVPPIVITEQTLQQVAGFFKKSRTIVTISAG